MLVYTLKKGINDTVLYDEDGVRGRFQFGPAQVADYKGLRGDPSDNIPGIKGIGEKTATELLIHFKTVEGIYTALKKDEGALRAVGVKDRMIALLRDNEEEALFSKMLATIRRDAPVTFTLPEHTWREGLEAERVLGLFAELGFRTLTTRVQTLFNMPITTEVQASEDIPAVRTGEVALALWLLSSDTTNPTYEDIMQYGRVHELTTFADIEAHIFAELKKQNLEKVYREIELPLMPVLRDMERTGIRIDTVHLATLGKHIHAEIGRLEKKMYAHVGMEFNINSPKQLGEILYDHLGLKPKNQKHTATGPSAPPVSLSSKRCRECTLSSRRFCATVKYKTRLNVYRHHPHGGGSGWSPPHAHFSKRERPRDACLHRTRIFKTFPYAQKRDDRYGEHLWQMRAIRSLP